MKLLHVTTRENLDSILKVGLKCKSKRVICEDSDGKIISDKTLPASECPPAIYSYPLVEDKKARYNCWVVGSEDDVAESDTIGIIFEPTEPKVSIGTWAFGSDFVTRKRPIYWSDFKNEIKALAGIVGQLHKISSPGIYDVLTNDEIFTKDNFHRLLNNNPMSGDMKDLFYGQFIQLYSFYTGGFEVCVMHDVHPKQIVAWVDLGGVTDSEAWFDKGLNSKRVERLR